MLVWKSQYRDHSSTAWNETYCQGNIIQHDIKSRRSLDQIIPDQPADVLTLRDQLTGVELCNHALKHFIHNRWQDSFVKVGAESAVYSWKSIDSWS